MRIIHKVWTAGSGTKVITIKDKVSRNYDVDIDDAMIIDWDKALTTGSIRIERIGGD